MFQARNFNPLYHYLWILTALCCHILAYKHVTAFLLVSLFPCFVLVLEKFSNFVGLETGIDMITSRLAVAPWEGWVRPQFKNITHLSCMAVKFAPCHTIPKGRGVYSMFFVIFDKLDAALVRLFLFLLSLSWNAKTTQESNRVYRSSIRFQIQFSVTHGLCFLLLLSTCICCKTHKVAWLSPVVGSVFELRL